MSDTKAEKTSLDCSLANLSLEEQANDQTIKKLTSFCKKQNIPTTGAIAFTMSRNRTGEYASLIANMEDGTLHELYPKPFNRMFKEGPVSEDQEFLYCYQCDLDPNPLREMKTASVDTNNACEPNELDAFCCSNLEPYRPRRTQNDAIFDQFVRGHGTLKDPTMLFEVKRQVDNGPLISTELFQLENGIRLRVKPTSSLQKVHSFKNYKCRVHNRFFGVDLCRSGTVHNQHHVRCVAFSKRNAELESAFFAHHNV
jgi:hypothetical protein